MGEERIWEAGTGVEQLDDLIEENVKEALKFYLTDELNGIMGSLPMEFFPQDGGNKDEHGLYKPPPSDPLTFRIFCDDLEYERDFSLTERLRESIDQCYEDGSYIEGLRIIGQRLRLLADRFEKVLATRDRVGEDARLDPADLDKA